VCVCVANRGQPSQTYSSVMIWTAKWGHGYQRSCFGLLLHL